MSAGTVLEDAEPGLFRPAMCYSAPDMCINALFFDTP